jgi:hypothetical protein
MRSNEFEPPRRQGRQEIKDKSLLQKSLSMTNVNKIESFVTEGHGENGENGLNWLIHEIILLNSLFSPCPSVRKDSIS